MNGLVDSQASISDFYSVVLVMLLAVPDMLFDSHLMLFHNYTFKSVGSSALCKFFRISLSYRLIHVPRLFGHRFVKSLSYPPSACNLQPGSRCQHSESRPLETISLIDQLVNCQIA